MKEPILRSLSGVTVECVEGDIARQAGIAAMVNAATPSCGSAAAWRARSIGLPAPGSGRNAGRSRRAHRAHRLPNRWVIHCLGPVYGVDEPADELLASCYRSALFIADHNEIDAIAFPAISTGAFGYPMAEAAKIAFRTVLEEIPRLEHVKRIRFVLFGQYALQVHKEALQSALKEVENATDSSREP